MTAASLNLFHRQCRQAYLIDDWQQRRTCTFLANEMRYLDPALVTLEEIVGLTVLCDLNKAHISANAVPVGSLSTVSAVSKGVEGLRIS